MLATHSQAVPAAARAAIDLPPLVTVVMPAYNAAAYIADAVDSVSAQTYRNWELIVVDDGSTDRTLEIVQSRQSKDSRISWVRSIQKGPRGARVTGIRAARGEYVAFLDADDLWLPRKLETQIGFMGQTSATFSYTRYRHMSADGAMEGLLVPAPRAFRYEDLFGRRGLGCSTVVMHVDVARRIGLHGHTGLGEDWAMWMDALRDGGIAHRVQGDLVRYRLAPGGRSSKKLQVIGKLWRLYRSDSPHDLPRRALQFARYVVTSTMNHVVCRPFRPTVCCSEPVTARR